MRSKIRSEPPGTISQREIAQSSSVHLFTMSYLNLSIVILQRVLLVYRFHSIDFARGLRSQPFFLFSVFLL